MTANNSISYNCISTAEVNAVSDYRRSLGECQRKLQHFVSESKKKVSKTLGHHIILIHHQCLKSLYNISGT